MSADPTLNLNDTTPTAATNGLNVKWQSSGATTDPRNVSAYVPGDGNTNHFLRGDGSWATPPNSSPMTTEGDLTFENATPAPDRLPIGTTGEVLTVVAGLPAWAAPTPMTTAGDLIYENATPAPARLPIGSNGQVLGIVSSLPAWVNSGATYQSVVGTGSTLNTSGVVAINYNSGSWTIPAPVNKGDRLTVIVSAQIWNGSSGLSWVFNCSNGDGWTAITLTSFAATSAGACCFELVYSGNYWQILYIEGGSSNI